MNRKVKGEKGKIKRGKKERQFSIAKFFGFHGKSSMKVLAGSVYMRGAISECAKGETV